MEAKVYSSYGSQFNDILEINYKPFWPSEHNLIRSPCSLSMVKGDLSFPSLLSPAYGTTRMWDEYVSQKSNMKKEWPPAHLLLKGDDCVWVRLD